MKLTNGEIVMSVLQLLGVGFLVIVLMFLFIKFITFLCGSSENRHQAPEIREHGDSQEDVWSISIPETQHVELPFYQELQPNPEKPPGYWTLYNKPVIKETL